MLGLVHFNGIVASMFSFGMARNALHGRHGTRIRKNSRPAIMAALGDGGECRSRLGLLLQPCFMQAGSMIR